eukprot:TRINITY_DN11287_c0_g1_i3.p1 TRINITY_DN11287_c0_g1~~TRINITY_DN11287_c0_g1_i3.p1  ORF type:complete len:188 (+),score=32.83 TRINITY_DN11287_c0_g1_i3:85-648(+)
MGGRKRSNSRSDYSASPKRGKSGRKDSRSRSRSRGRGRSSRKSRLEKFCDDNELKESTYMKLKNSDPDDVKAVIDLGWNVIENARNADAVVVSRLRKIQNGESGGGGGRRRERSRSRRSRSRPRGGGGGGMEQKPGDWICDKCSAMNFARRTECFKCHAPRDDRGRRRSRSASRSRSRSRSRRRSRS